MNNGSFCIILGMWLFISGFVEDLMTPLNLSISGVLAISLSLYGLLFLKRKRSITLGVLGIWLTINTILFQNIVPFNFIFIGFIIAILGFSCICRPDDNNVHSNKPLREKLKNCFIFYKN
jgi:hypothetical protein